MAKQWEILLPGERRRRGKRWRMVVLALALPAALLAWPHLEATRIPRPGGEPADAAMVLAGGEKRIAEGLRFFLEGKARELYIIGAGRGSTAARVVPGYDSMPEETRRRIFVEAWSENTIENAASVKSVATERRFKRLVLVTSDYHAPRAFRAVRGMLSPAVSVQLLQVRGERREKGWFWRQPRLFMAESVKYWWFRVLIPFE
jgi:uncharacterized SAM-binding protein YcdF (DUF218 family)